MKNWVVLAFLPLAVAAAPVVHAQDADIRIGETRLAPSVRLVYLASDNAFRQEQDEVDETGFSVIPSFRWEASQGRNVIAAEYTGDFYTSSEESLDRDQHTLQVQGLADTSSKHRLGATFRLEQNTEDFDEGFSRSLIAESLDELVEFRDIAGIAFYTFGSQGAKGNIRISLSALSRTFLNQDDITSGGDYTALRPALNFSYRVGGDSRAFVAFRHLTVDFDESLADRTQLSALLGLRFNESRKLSGEIAVGIASNDRDLGDDDTTAILEAALNYDINSFSRLNLEIDREFVDDDGDASLSGNRATIQSNVSLTWGFDWSSRVSTTASLDLTDNIRNCDDNDNTIVVAGIEAEYQFRRWLSFGIDIDRESNSVDLCPGVGGGGESTEDNDYDRTTAGLYLRASL